VYAPPGDGAKAHASYPFAAADCNQYARFRAWTARSGWRDRRRDVLTGAG
jgi:hypothetical protein